MIHRRGEIGVSAGQSQPSHVLIIKMTDHAAIGLRLVDHLDGTVDLNDLSRAICRTQKIKREPITRR